MNELTTEDLLLYISDFESDRKMAEECFVELYNRHAQALTTAVKRHLRNRNIYNEELLHSIVSNTFHEVWLNAVKFSYDASKHKSEESAFRAWIYIIARNEFADILRESIKFSEVHVLDDEDQLVEQMAEIEVDEEHLSGNRKALEQALSTLTERERHILLTCYDYYAEGKNTPSEVLDRLSEHWGTTKDNVRQIKKRSLDKVRKQLQSHNHLTVKK